MAEKKIQRESSAKVHSVKSMDFMASSTSLVLGCGRHNSPCFNSKRYFTCINQAKPSKSESCDNVDEWSGCGCLLFRDPRFGGGLARRAKIFFLPWYIPIFNLGYMTSLLPWHLALVLSSILRNEEDFSRFHLILACSWTRKAHGSQFHLKYLNFEVALTISGIIITPNVSINRNPLKTHVSVALGGKFQMFFLDISLFGLTYPFLEGGGNARRPKKIYIPRVIFNIPGLPWRMIDRMRSRNLELPSFIPRNQDLNRLWHTDLPVLRVSPRGTCYLFSCGYDKG